MKTPQILKWVSLNILFLILFAALAVWLSIANKNCRQDLSRAEASVKTLQKETEALTNTTGMALEAFALNINRQPIAMAFTIELPKISMGSLPLLYLKANACSSCNNRSYIDLVERLKSNPDFRIVSHPTNRFYIRQLLAAYELNDAKMVTYTDANLLDPGFSATDAELLFVNPQGKVTSGIPVDLLRNQAVLNVVEGALGR